MGKAKPTGLKSIKPHDDFGHNSRKGRAGVTLQMEYRTHVKPTSSNDTIKQMTSTWRSKINACNIIQRNLIRQIYKYTIKKYIQIHNKECTEISPRDSCFAQWGSSDESRDHCAAKIQHIDIPRQYESQLRQQSTRKHRMVNDVTPFLKHAVIQNYKEFCQSQALWGRQSRRA